MKTMLNAYVYIFILIVSIFLSACVSTTTKSGAVGVKRKQMLLVSQQEAEQRAAKLYAAEKRRYQAKGALNNNRYQVRRVRRITNRLIRQVGVFRADARNWDWEIMVISSPSLNAYCMPGGKMAVYSGLMTRLKLRDSELAAIIGHEIAHALREHAREQMSTQAAKSIGISVLGHLLKANQSQMKIADTLTTIGIQLPHSRQHEREADRMGIELAARAGYNPMSAVSFWQQMLHANKQSQGMNILSTHPTTESRIKDIRKYAIKLMPIYQSSRAKTLRR